METISALRPVFICLLALEFLILSNGFVLADSSIYGFSDTYGNIYSYQELDNPFVEEKKDSGYVHHSCSFTRCMESCIYDEFVEGDVMDDFLENLMKTMRDCLCGGVTCGAFERFEDAYTAYDVVTSCRSECDEAESSDDPRAVGECVRCRLAAVGGAIPGGGGCIVGAYDLLGDLLVPHTDCLSECAAPAGTWENNRGHQCHITNELRYGCMWTGDVGKYWCEDCEWVYDELVDVCREGCTQTSRTEASCNEDLEEDGGGGGSKRRCRTGICGGGGAGGGAGGAGGAGGGGAGDSDDDNGPGGDRPDDSYDISSLNLKINQVNANNNTPDIAVLDLGFSPSAMNIILELEESPSLVSLAALETIRTEDFPVLVIPSGGLHGLESSPTFKSWLEEYVGNGGVVIVFSQQHGYEYQALPGNLTGYGWSEDQSCHHASVGISTYHPIFSGQNSVILDVNVDGFFTSYPEDAAILLSRTKNGQPAMLMYEYGRGAILASTLYSDMASSIYQGTADEEILLKDIIKWAKNYQYIPSYALGTFNISINVTNPYLGPLEYPVSEFEAGKLINLSINVTNYGNVSADKVSFILFDPLFNQTCINESVNIGVNESQFVNLSYQTTNSSVKGIWSILYLLYNGDDAISSGWGGEFALDYNIANLSRFKAYVTIKDPDGNPVSTEENIPLFIRPGETGSINLTVSSDRYGLWSARYSVLTDEGEVFASDSYLFAVSSYADNPEGWVYQRSNISFYITSPNEDYFYGEDVPFTVHIVNRANEFRIVNLTYWNSTVHNWGWGFRETWGRCQESNPGCAIETLSLPPEDEVTTTITVRWFKLVHPPFDALLYDQYGNLLGYAMKVIELHMTYFDVNIETDKREYMTGDIVNVTLNITSIYNLTRTLNNPDDVTVEFRILDSGYNRVFQDTFNLNLTPGESENITIPFNLTPALQPGVYTVMADVYYQHFLMGRASSLFEVNRNYSIDINFDEPERSYREGQNMTLHLNVTNYGDEFLNSTLNVSIQSFNFNETLNVSVSPNETVTISFSLTVPEGINPGLHEVSVTNSCDNSLTKEWFSIPQSKLEYEISDEVNAGENLSIKLRNTGGVSAGYSYSAILRDVYLTTVLNESVSGLIRAGENLTFNYSLAENLINGTYFLILEIKNNRTGEVLNSIKPLLVNGTHVLLSSKADKKIYSSGEEVIILTNITKLRGEVAGSILNLKILSRVPITAEPCVEPKDDLYVDSDITLCPGIYNIPDEGQSGVIIINSSGVEIRGNNTFIVGTGSGYGIYNFEFDDVSIRDINVENYRYGIYLYFADNNTVTVCNASGNSDSGFYIRTSEYNNIYGNIFSSNRYGIYLYGSDNNTITGNNASGNSDFGIYIRSSDDNQITSNQFMSNTKYGIYLDSYLDNNNISTNEVNGSGTAGIYIDESSRLNNIDNNRVNGDIYYHLVDERDAVIENLVLEAKNVTNLGKISLINCTNITIRNVNASNNYGSGIYVYESDDIVMESLTASQNKYGVDAYHSTYCTIENSLISGSERGIYLGYSDNATITRNTIQIGSPQP